MVVELTSLAGTMAREYARRAGETEAVAQALYDMELPRSAGDPVPVDHAGCAAGAGRPVRPAGRTCSDRRQADRQLDPFALRRGRRCGRDPA